MILAPLSRSRRRAARVGAAFRCFPFALDTFRRSSSASPPDPVGFPEALAEGEGGAKRAHAFRSIAEVGRRAHARPEKDTGSGG